MPSVCVETVTQEQSLVLEPRNSMPPIKPDGIKDKLRAGMTTFARDIVFLYRLLRHPETPTYARGLLLVPVMYLCSPIQLIPNCIPVLGQMDDVFVIWITKKFVRKLIDQKTWQDCRDAAAATKFLFPKQLHERSKWKIYSSRSGAPRRP